MLVQDVPGMVSELIQRFVPQVWRIVNLDSSDKWQSTFKLVAAGSSDAMTRQVAAENACIEQQLVDAWMSLHKIDPMDCSRCVHIIWYQRFI